MWLKGNAERRIQFFVFWTCHTVSTYQLLRSAPHAKIQKWHVPSPKSPFVADRRGQKATLKGWSDFFLLNLSHGLYLPLVQKCRSCKDIITTTLILSYYCTSHLEHSQILAKVVLDGPKQYQKLFICNYSTASISSIALGSLLLCNNNFSTGIAGEGECLRGVATFSGCDTLTKNSSPAGINPLD